MQSLTAVVLGATGLVGEQLVQQLLADAAYSKVRILVRRPVEMSHEKLEVVITDFENSVAFRNNVGKGDCIFCCVGTTQKKVKGDNKAYHKVDVDIPVRAAKMAKDVGFTKYLLVSAAGANRYSKSLYLGWKGEAEGEIAAVNFDSFHVFRPGILLGERKEFRLVETMAKVIMKSISPFMTGSLNKYRAISAVDVAKAMVVAAKSDKPGMFVHHYEDMMQAKSE